MFFMLIFFVSGCASLGITRTRKLTKDFPVSDTEKDDFIRNCTSLSELHGRTQGIYTAKIDYSRLNGKTCAILFADFMLETELSFTSEDAVFFANNMVDFFKKHFSKVGIEFIPNENVLNNKTYSSLIYEERKEKGTVVRASAYGLKYVSMWTISFNPKSVLNNMTEIAKELNVDYVMFIKIEGKVKYKGLNPLRYITRKSPTAHTVIKRVLVELVDKEKVVWSFSTPKSPSILDIKEQLLGSLWPFEGLISEGVKMERSDRVFKIVTEIKESKKFFDSTLEILEKIAELAAYKFNKDRMTH